jgi:hypothetical protein
VTTDHSVTALAFPRFLLLHKELLNSVFLDEPQVVYHTHPVARPVPFVDSLQSLARKVLALETKSDFTLR